MRPLLALAALCATASLVLADWGSDLHAFNVAFQSQFPENRVEAVKALRGADHAEGAKLLVARFNNEKDAAVRDALADALADMRSDKARAATREAILTERNDNRRALLCGLLAAGRRVDRADLLKVLLADRSEKVRLAACGVIGQADVSLIPQVARAAGGSAESGVAVVEALGRVNSIEAAPALIDVLGTATDATVKKAAIASLVRMSDRNWGENVEGWQGWMLQQRAKDMSPVDRAIFLGAANLRPQLATLLNIPGARYARAEGDDTDAPHLVALLVYALHHAGTPNDDPVMVAGVAFMKSAPLDFTYTASLQALALADMDAKAHAGRLFEIAQWLADQQCENGQWSYGRREILTVSPGAVVETGPRFRVAWHDLRRDAQGDGSNTQFAILALRAALEAGVEMPAILWERSLEWYVKNEGKDDGQAGPGRRDGTVESGADKLGGWGYGYNRSAPYHSMTCSGLCAVTICLRALGRDLPFRNGKPETEPMIGRGLGWLDNHWDTGRSAGRGGWGTYYDLYSLERVGMILNLPKIGSHDWYQEGVDRLLPLQSPRGSWAGNAVDTALAILFLRKATHGYPSDPKDK